MSTSDRFRASARRLLTRLRGLLRPPRRLSFTRAGWLFTAGALAIGTAAIPTGNNLLFLLLGTMLGFIAVSGWLSEQCLQRLEIERRVPRGATAGTPARIEYRVRNHKRRLPSLALELRERELEAVEAVEGGDPRPAWLLSLAAGEARSARTELTLSRRGVYPLDELTLAEMRGGFSEFILCARDVHGLYANVAGVLTAHDVNILASHVYSTRSGLALEVYRLAVEEGFVNPNVTEVFAQYWPDVPLVLPLRDAADLPALLRDYPNARAVWVMPNRLDPAIIDAAHAEGLLVVVYLLQQRDTAEFYEAATDQGVDLIVLDHIDDFRAWRAERMKRASAGQP